MLTVLLPISYDENDYNEWHIALVKVALFAMKLDLTKEQFISCVTSLPPEQQDFCVKQYIHLRRELSRNKSRDRAAQKELNQSSPIASSVVEPVEPVESVESKKTMPARLYERLTTIDIPTVFHNMRGKLTFRVSDTETTDVIVKSKRYRTFHKKGVICVRCGIEGHYFAVERQISQTSSRFHLNLYHKDKVTGKEILMTVDHILPSSRGGSDKVDNLQPMCCICNHKKGNSIQQEDAMLLGIEPEQIKFAINCDSKNIS